MSNMYESETKWKSIGNETEIIQKSTKKKKILKKCDIIITKF